MALRIGSDAQLKVTPAELEAKSQSVNAISEKMKTQYDELKSIINSSGGYWIGEGGDAHRKKFNEQSGDVDEMFRRIKEHVLDLQSMAGVYTAAEEEVKSMIYDTLPSDVII